MNKPGFFLYTIMKDQPAAPGFELMGWVFESLLGYMPYHP